MSVEWLFFQSQSHRPAQINENVLNTIYKESFWDETEGVKPQRMKVDNMGAYHQYVSPGSLGGLETKKGGSLLSTETNDRHFAEYLHRQIEWRWIDSVVKIVNSYLHHHLYQASINLGMAFCMLWFHVDGCSTYTKLF